MWSRLLEFIGRGYRDRRGAEAACGALEAKYPEAEATEVWLRAREAERDVVAVLYSDRGKRTIRRGAPRYRLFAIRRDHTTEELPVESDSPYLIRGIK